MKKLLFSVLVALSLVCCTTGCSQEEIEYLNWTHFAWFNNSDYPVMLSVQNTRNEFIFQHERIEPGRKFEIVEYSELSEHFPPPSEYVWAATVAFEDGTEVYYGGDR